MPSYQYAGFWIRVVATIIDAIIWVLIVTPIIYFFGPDNYYSLESNFSTWDIILQIIYAVVCITFWLKLAATPGKLLLGLKVLDAETGNTLSVGQAVIRYIMYFPSTILLLIGLIWVAFDGKKQGWHDKVAKSVVVKQR